MKKCMVCTRKGSRLLRVVEQEGGAGPEIPTRGCFTEWNGAADGRALYVGRRHRTASGRVFAAPTFANLFKLQRAATSDQREVCLAKYRSYLLARRDFPLCLRGLAGRVLICHCKKIEACHADVLIEAFRQEFHSERGCVAHMGAPWTVDDFTRLAFLAEHPYEELVLPDVLKRSVVDRFTRGVEATLAARENYLRKWEARAAQLEVAEARLHRRMDSDVRRAMRGKRLLIFEEMLVDVGFPRAALLVKRMSEGFHVIGDVAATDVYEPRPAQAKMERTELLRNARVAQDILLATVGPSGDDEIDQALDDTTAAELKEGWLRGPFTREELDAKFDSWVPVKRFGIKQGAKVRAIDDYSLLGQNAATAVAEKVDLTGVDFVAACARAYLAAPAAGGRVELELSTGDIYGG